MADIVALPTRLDIPPERVLTAALNVSMDAVLVLGYDKDGKFYAASSCGSEAANIMLIERFKYKMLSGEYAD
jgi:hypothetical protein